MKPVICNYYLTYRCNARCGFCSIRNDAGVPVSCEASPDVIAKNLGAVRNAGVKIVDFTGGEPLLYDGLPEVLRHAKRIGLRTTVTTNGIVYADRAKNIAGLVDFLQFSLSGATADVHDSVTVTPSFDKVLNGVESALGLGERPVFIHTVTDGNIENVSKVIGLTRSMNVPVFLNPAFSYPGAKGISTESVRRLNGLSRGRGVAIDRGYLKFVLDGGNKKDRPLCRAVSSTIVISPDDKLVLPCFHFRKKEIPVQDDLPRLLTSPEVREERHMEGRHPFCEGCTVYCYMRASLFRPPGKYSFGTILSGMKYLYEWYRVKRR